MAKSINHESHVNFEAVKSIAYMYSYGTDQYQVDVDIENRRYCIVELATGQRTDWGKNQQIFDGLKEIFDYSAEIFNSTCRDHFIINLTSYISVLRRAI